jgi:hypothetical protein
MRASADEVPQRMEKGGHRRKVDSFGAKACNLTRLKAYSDYERSVYLAFLAKPAISRKADRCAAVRLENRGLLFRRAVWRVDLSFLSGSQLAEDVVDVQLHPMLDNPAIIDSVENHEIRGDVPASRRNTGKVPPVHSSEGRPARNPVVLSDHLLKLDLVGRKRRFSLGDMLLQARIAHILVNQLFGFRLTAQCLKIILDELFVVGSSQAHGLLLRISRLLRQIVS